MPASNDRAAGDLRLVTHTDDQDEQGYFDVLIMSAGCEDGEANGELIYNTMNTSDDFQQFRVAHMDEAVWDGGDRLMDINKAIDNAIIVLAVMSKTFLNDGEAINKTTMTLQRYFRDGGVSLFPVCVPRKKDLLYWNDLPTFITNKHHMDFNPQNPEAFMRRLLGILCSKDKQRRRKSLIQKQREEKHKSSQAEMERQMKELRLGQLN